VEWDSITPTIRDNIHSSFVY